MDFQTLFKKIRNEYIMADTSAIQGKLAIQINITGEGEGSFYIEVNEGKLAIEPYDYKDRDVAISVSADNFRKLMEGNVDPVMLYTLGKLKIEGDIGKALELKKFI